MWLERLDVVRDTALLRIEHQVLHDAEIRRLWIAETPAEGFDDTFFGGRAMHEADAVLAQLLQHAQ